MSSDPAHTEVEDLEDGDGGESDSEDGEQVMPIVIDIMESNLVLPAGSIPQGHTHIEVDASFSAISSLLQNPEPLTDIEDGDDDSLPDLTPLDDSDGDD